ncbi:shwachman-Bodian-Diamond syndrome protein [Diplocarpon rosae]|nr:shwachman-Bodian-Diamond syndrome protein [Diplocarpon rosae]
MARGEAQQTKVHYKGSHEDFIIFVDDVKSAEAWKTDKSIPLAQVVSSFKVFTTHKYVLEDVIKLIIEKGTIQETEGPDRSASKNDSMGARSGH